MSTNCSCKNNISNSCSNQQTLDEIYKIQRRILEGSKCGNNTVIINDSVMTYVADEDFPLPICDNVRASIVNYTDRHQVSKEVFEQVIDGLVAAIEDLDRRVTASSVIPYDVDVENSLSNGQADVNLGN